MQIAIPLGIISFIFGIVLFIRKSKNIKDNEIVDNKIIWYLLSLFVSIVIYFVAISRIAYHYGNIEPVKCIDSSTFTSNCSGNNESASIIFLITIGISIIFGVIFYIILNKIFKSGSKSFSIASFIFYYIVMSIFSIILLLEFNGVLVSVSYNTHTTILEAFAIVSPILIYPVISTIKKNLV